MSHHIYQTEAFVLDSKNTGEANKVIFLFTKELGLVAGIAQGIRHLKSKLRYSLQDFSYSKVSLVRGKEMWRVTSAGLVDVVQSKNNPAGFTFVRALVLVKRLVQGEEKNEALWSVLASAFEYVRKTAVEKDASEDFECLLILRILHTLGYIAASSETAVFLAENTWNDELFKQISVSKTDILTQINKALKESHL
jgi:DNA repair protein RecO